MSWRSLAKIAGSRSASGTISQRHGSEDLDPHQMSWIQNTDFNIGSLLCSFRLLLKLKNHQAGFLCIHRLSVDWLFKLCPEVFPQTRQTYWSKLTIGRCVGPERGPIWEICVIGLPRISNPPPSPTEGRGVGEQQQKSRGEKELLRELWEQWSKWDYIFLTSVSKSLRLPVNFSAGSAGKFCQEVATLTGSHNHGLLPRYQHHGFLPSSRGVSNWLINTLPSL